MMCVSLNLDFFLYALLAVIVIKYEKNQAEFKSSINGDAG